MYERTVAGRTLSFGHAGMLYLDSFVLYDRETDSLWVQASGRAFHGTHEGRRLRLIPSTTTTWEQWKARFPHTLVLDKRRGGPAMGTYEGLHRTRNLGLAVVIRFQAKHYPFDALAARPVVNDRHHGVPLLVVYAPEGAAAWSREVDGRALTFASEEGGAAGVSGGGLPPLKDAETGSTWDWLTGEAVAGPLRGRRLPAVTHHPILTDRFRAFYPDAPVWGE